jgi:hypothetical protein
MSHPGSESFRTELLSGGSAFDREPGIPDPFRRKGRVLDKLLTNLFRSRPPSKMRRTMRRPTTGLTHKSEELDSPRIATKLCHKTVAETFIPRAAKPPNAESRQSSFLTKGNRDALALRAHSMPDDRRVSRQCWGVRPRDHHQPTRRFKRASHSLSNMNGETVSRIDRVIDSDHARCCEQAGCCEQVSTSVASPTSLLTFSG